MTRFNEDSIITEVRKNRAEVLAEFVGNTKKLIEHLISQRPAMEVAGWRYETNEELESRIFNHKIQREEEQRRIEAISYKPTLWH